MAELGTCPVASAHRRLRDVHEYWHAAAEAYMDPDAFRRSLNTAIQELRNISFLVQKEKDALTDFETWYAEWQGEVRNEPTMRWIVESRNRIVKQGDLDLLSKMHVRYHLDWTASGEMEADFPPRTPPIIAARMMLTRLGLPPYGLVTVRRRWTDFRLPGVELLDALATAYRRCGDLLEKAHRPGRVNACGISLATSECLFDSANPECMANVAGWTEASLDASTGEFNGLRHYVVESSETGMEEALQRYGAPDDLTGSLRGTDALEAVDVYLEMGKRILAVESDLMMVCVYFKEAKIVHMEGGKTQDHFGKVLWADHLASKAITLGATSLLISADVWEARITGTDIDRIPVSERADKSEALSVMAVCRDGRSVSKRLRYSRRPDGSADFGDIVVDKVGATRYLEPLRKAWELSSWEDAS